MNTQTVITYIGLFLKTIDRQRVPIVTLTDTLDKLSKVGVSVRVRLAGEDDYFIVYSTFMEVTETYTITRSIKHGTVEFIIPSYYDTHGGHLI